MLVVPAVGYGARMEVDVRGSSKYPKDLVSAFLKREALSRAIWGITGLRIGEKIDSPPPINQSALELIVEIMFFASMAVEEGHVQPVGVVFAERREEFESSHWSFIAFSEPRVFAVGEIAKLAAVPDFPRSLLAVMPGDQGLSIVGVASPGGQSLFRKDDLIRVLAPDPGVLVLGRGAREVARYVRGQILDQPPYYWGHRDGQEQRQLLSIAASLGPLAPDSQDGRSAAIKAYLQGQLVFNQILHVVSEMSRLRHGGIVAILGPNDDAQVLLARSRALELPMEYGAVVRDQLRAESDWVRGGDWEKFKNGALVEKLGWMRRQIVGFTAVDGAVLLSHSLQVLGFGVKLPVPPVLPDVVQIGSDGTPGGRWPLEIRGTRHAAAASFAEQHPDGVAFIVSQDGDAAVFQSVGAHVVYWPLGVPLGDMRVS
ncbi:putative sensor domain DACNV-containing protein [Corallococcus sp. 4LFB]|uniref:putative sensor domain DACNV-containing protein n=1 Tax=Corallococcus sp. 4LFB TaxID=3383249 RepID=UPI003974E27C